MKKEPDLYYQERGLFIRFIPNTYDGEVIWVAMAAHESSCTFLATNKSHILKQLHDAGITFKKLRSPKFTKNEIRELMNELDVIERGVTNV